MCSEKRLGNESPLSGGGGDGGNVRIRLEEDPII